MKKERLISPALACILLTLVTSLAFAAEPEWREEVSLNGTWEIVFDVDDEGAANHWHLNEVFSRLESRRAIEVPSAWELIEEDYEGVAYYRRAFEAPSAWSERIVRLHFGAVNYRAELWLNDEVLGVHEGGFTPFDFRIDQVMRPGEVNVLILRVLGPIVLTDKTVDGIGPMETPQWRGGLTGGIWQGVRLIATGQAYIEDVFIEPKWSEKSASFQVEVNHTAAYPENVELEIEIREARNPGGVVTRVRDGWRLRPGVNQRDWTLEIPEAKAWSPDDPHLYRSQVRIIGEGGVSDRWSHRFGLRELTIRNRDFYLNGRPIYIKAAFFEGLYPNGIAYPDSEEMARREIRLAKEAGFNMIRPWRHPPAPAWLDLADEMGVMTVGSPALECMDLPVSTPYLPGRVENEVREAILRDRNRASIVQWELFNELRRPILKQMLRPMALFARKLDPTRLILDESGGWAFGANMYLPYEYEPTRFNDIHTYPGPFIDERLFDGFLAIGLSDEERQARGLTRKAPGRNLVPGLMSFVSELGYGSLPDLVENNERFRKEGNPRTPAYRYHRRLAEGQKEVLKASGFEALYPDLRKFFLDQQRIHGAANKRMIEAVRSNPDVDGYCIHALVAGDWILGAGLLDLWRNPKSYAYEATRAANRPRILPIRIRPRNVYEKQGASLEVTGVNELEEISGTLAIRIKDADARNLYRKEIPLSWSSSVSPLYREALSTEGWQGEHTAEVRFTSADGAVVARNSHRFRVFSEEELKVPRVEIAVFDPSAALRPFLEEKGIKAVEFGETTPLSTPLFVTGTSKQEAGADDLLREALRFVESGGTAVLIEGFRAEGPGEPDPALSALTISFEVHPARGLWTCIPHLVLNHPVFTGLPSGAMMEDTYQNVWATETLRGLEGEALVASIGFEWFSPQHRFHHSGPGESWWGSDLALLRRGGGRLLVSQLRIVENLGRDPVAERLLFNLIRFAAE